MFKLAKMFFDVGLFTLVCVLFLDAKVDKIEYPSFVKKITTPEVAPIPVVVDMSGASIIYWQKTNDMP